MATAHEMESWFPLFAAPSAEAAGWEDAGTCVVCGDERPGLRLGAGDYVVGRCARCGTATPAPADGRAERCASCPDGQVRVASVQGRHGCWRCLRDGRWTSTKDTEAGMVTPVHALRGRTHGRPVLRPHVDAGAGPVEPELAGWPAVDANVDGWRVALVPPEVLGPLVRTPTYATFQGDVWQFHCGRAMRYRGRWGRRHFDRSAPAAGAALASTAAGLPAEGWEGLADEPDDGRVWVYMFDCPSCGALKGHWDAD